MSVTGPSPSAVDIGKIVSYHRPICSKKCSFSISKAKMGFTNDNVLTVVCSHSERKVVGPSTFYARPNAHHLSSTNIGKQAVNNCWRLDRKCSFESESYAQQVETPMLLSDTGTQILKSFTHLKHSKGPLAWPWEGSQVGRRHS